MSREQTGQSMPQIATGCNNKISADRDDVAKLLITKELNQKQQSAIELLLQGCTDTQVAQQLATDRTTIFRWRTRSQPFIREMERQRQLLWQQAAGRLQAMIQPALDILERQMREPDPKAALRAAAILLRFATPRRLGVTDDPSTPAPDERRSATSELMDQLEAYIDAPMPGE